MAERTVNEERTAEQKAIHDAVWWGAFLAGLGAFSHEAMSVHRVARAGGLADLAVTEARDRDIVPPGVVFAGEPVKLQQGSAPNITMNIAASDPESLRSMLAVLEQSGAMTSAPDSVHSAFVADVAAAQVRSRIHLLELIKGQLQPFVGENETLPGALARILDGHRARMTSETQP